MLLQISWRVDVGFWRGVIVIVGRSGYWHLFSDVSISYLVTMASPFGISAVAPSLRRAALLTVRRAGRLRAWISDLSWSLFTLEFVDALAIGDASQSRGAPSGRPINLAGSRGEVGVPESYDVSECDVVEVSIVSEEVTDIFFSV
ncbi:hypothetical protein DY000_02012652 [Brassica cretica]|uniref:Uncharacterized protein n=1 Tax=Brassica cretica TaxID=69181 RepID=A0ABQ7CUV1_BRACR|nr:hypothetical protein DY000_02012652 [Brassica cretica]